jgi:hypothetical protein
MVVAWDVLGHTASAAAAKAGAATMRGHSRVHQEGLRRSASFTAAPTGPVGGNFAESRGQEHRRRSSVGAGSAASSSASAGCCDARGEVTLHYILEGHSYSAPVSPQRSGRGRSPMMASISLTTVTTATRAASASSSAAAAAVGPLGNDWAVLGRTAAQLRRLTTARDVIHNSTRLLALARHVARRHYERRDVLRMRTDRPIATVLRVPRGGGGGTPPSSRGSSPTMSTSATPSTVLSRNASSASAGTFTMRSSSSAAAVAGGRLHASSAATSPSRATPTAARHSPMRMTGTMFPVSGVP